MSVEKVEQILAEIFTRKEQEKQEMGEQKPDKRQKRTRFLPKPAPPPLRKQSRPPTDEEEEDAQDDDTPMEQDQRSPEPGEMQESEEFGQPIPAPTLAPKLGKPNKMHPKYIPLNARTQFPQEWMTGHPAPLSHPQRIHNPSGRFRHPIEDPNHPMHQPSYWQPPSPPDMQEIHDRKLMEGMGAGEGYDDYQDELLYIMDTQEQGQEDWMATGDEHIPITVPVPIPQSKAKPAKKRYGGTIGYQGKHQRIGYRAKWQMPSRDKGVEPSDESDAQENDRVKKRYTRATNANDPKAPKLKKVWVTIGGKMVLAKYWDHGN